MNNSPILLTGITGSGKSTVWRDLAESMGRSFSNLDDKVLELYGNSNESLDDLITRLWSLNRFRTVEHDALLHQLTNSYGPQIISLGWWAPTYNPTRLLMQKWALRVVWLTAPEETLWARIQADMQQGNNRATITREIFHQKMEDRESIYRWVSDFTIANIWTTQECVNTILTKLHYGRICVPITQWDTDSLDSAITTVNNSPEIRIVELRIDTIPLDIKIWDVLKQVNKIEKHILVTNRTEQEQAGGFSGKWQEWIKRVEQFAHLAKYIDVEIDRESEVIEAYKSTFPEVSLILSFHSFGGTPTLWELQKKVDLMMQYEYDQIIIPKIAVMPKSEDDVQIIYELTDWFKKVYPGYDFIFISMGEIWKKTRIDIPKQGGLLTFGALTENGGSAPGQVYYPDLYNKIYWGKD